jgi:hypothetical protein
MAIEDLAGLVLEVGRLALWLKAVGIAALIWLVFESVALWFNYKRLRDVGRIKEDIKRIEGKIDRILRGKR